jgi:hypothetical protein
VTTGHGRFDYAIEIPDGGRASAPWQARLRGPVESDEPRLVGHGPLVDLEDFDVRPGVCRTRITLTAASAENAGARALSFVVDRGFAEMLQPHDVLNVSRGYHDQLGVSVLRRGILVGAAGAVSLVPLGDAISVRYPSDLAAPAAAIFRARDPQYRMWETPVEVTTEAGTRLLHRGRPTLGIYEVFVVHGFVLGCECVAITLPRVCPDCAATLTAPLLEQSGNFTITPFEDPRLLRELRILLALEAARLHFEKGDLDAAESSAWEAIIYDRENDTARALLERIDERRRR